MVRYAVCLCCDWPELLLWYWFENRIVPSHINCVTYWKYRARSVAMMACSTSLIIVLYSSADKDPNISLPFKKHKGLQSSQIRQDFKIIVKQDCWNMQSASAITSHCTSQNELTRSNYHLKVLQSRFLER